MKTEEEIVYDILNIVHGGRVSADNVISERLIRSFLRKHRASKMYEFFNKGMSLYDYVFQDLGDLEFEIIEENEFKVSVPAVINFKENFGIKISKNRFPITVLNQEEYELALSNPINKTHPKANLQGSVLTIYKGEPNSCDYHATSPKEKTVETFNLEASEVDDVSKITANVKAVLYDPSNAPSYDWTKSVYPCPSEIIDKIETSTLARDLDLLMRTTADQIDNKSQIDKV